MIRFFFFLSFAFIAVWTTPAVQASWTFEEAGQVGPEPKTGVRDFPFVLDETFVRDHGPFGIEASALLKQGKVTFRVMDPEGHVIWSSNCEAGKMDVSDGIGGIDAGGTYRFQVDYDECVGAWSALVSDGIGWPPEPVDSLLTGFVHRSVPYVVGLLLVAIAGLVILRSRRRVTSTDAD